MSKSPSPRKEVMSLRIEPKLKYLVELGARIQRRNLTNYVEWALEESLKQVFLDSDKNLSLSEMATVNDLVWSTDESSRFLFLAFFLKDLMTYEEQSYWELIRSFPNLFLLRADEDISMENINDTEIKKYWDLIKKASAGDRESHLKLAEEDSIRKNQRELMRQEIQDMIKALQKAKTKTPGNELSDKDRENIIKAADTMLKNLNYNNDSSE